VKDGIKFRSQLLPPYKILSETCCAKAANGVGEIIELEMIRSDTQHASVGLARKPKKDIAPDL
jgi:hypothetical protein